MPYYRVVLPEQVWTLEAENQIAAYTTVAEDSLIPVFVDQSYAYEIDQEDFCANNGCEEED